MATRNAGTEEGVDRSCGANSTEEGHRSTVAPQGWPILCLSGGGFRASAYHLGLLAGLRQLGCLEAVKHIVGVSGGSIVAAKASLHWQYLNDAKTWNECVEVPLMALMRHNIRGRMLLRAGLTLGVFDVRAGLMRAYDKFLFHSLDLKSACSAGPTLHILAAEIDKGETRSFTCRGGSVAQLRTLNGKQDEGQVAAVERIRISKAVAASSAFPGFFPPIQISCAEIGDTTRGAAAHCSLTDGGVIDNLGISMALYLRRTEAVLDAPILVSDAGGHFAGHPKSWRTRLFPGHLLVRTAARATEVLSNGLRIEALRNARSSTNVTIVGLHEAVELSEAVPEAVRNRWPTATTAQAARRIRTDFDAFTAAEIGILYDMGLCAAYSAVPG